MNKNIKKISNSKEAFNKPVSLHNVKDFNIHKSTLFLMTDSNTFEIEFKKKVLEEDFVDFLKKNLPASHSNVVKALSSQIFKIQCSAFVWKYQFEQTFKYAEEFTNLVNKKFSSLNPLTNEEVFDFKSMLSKNFRFNGKVTFGNKLLIIVACMAFLGFISDKFNLSSTSTSSSNYLEAQRPYYLSGSRNPTHTECIYNKNGERISKYMQIVYPCPSSWTGL